MSQEIKRLYEFGPFSLDPAESLLLRDGRPVPLKPKVLQTLVVLVENGGHVVEKEELMKRLWPDSFVEEANLTVNISQLRKALGENGVGAQYIETVPKRGYRFTADVREVGNGQQLILREQRRTRIVIEERETEDEESTGSAVADSLEAEPNYAPSQKLARAAQLEEAPTVMVGRQKTRRTAVVVTAASLLAIAALGFGLYKYFGPSPAPRFEHVAMTKITNLGKVLGAAVSPDGKYVAYIESEAGRESLWVKDTATGSTVQVLEPDYVKYGERNVTMDFSWLAFSPDGNYIYYSRTEKGGSAPSLYKVPKLGGMATRLIEDFDGPITFSPDGAQIAFVRNTQTESLLSVANVDGAGERVIAERKDPDYFTPRALAWSPDGDSIACVEGNHGPEPLNLRVVTVRVSDGAVVPLTSRKWKWVHGMAWLKDGSGLLMAAADESGWQHQQIWQVSSAGGEVRRVTNDTAMYTGVSLPSDSATLVTTQMHASSTIWVAPDGDAALARQISSGINDGLNGFGWTPDGNVVYPSLASGYFDIWIMDADGGNKKQLNFDAAEDCCPAVTPDGRYVVFTSTRAGGLTLWRMDIDGSHLKQLTNGYDYTPQVSPDGKWVVYVHSDGGKPTAWKVSINGGEAVPLTDKISYWPTVSPDGKLLAFEYWDERPDSRRKIAVMPFEGGPIKTFDYVPAITASGFMRWTTDGRALTYINMQGDSRIWIQPLDGGPPKELADFKSERVWNINWSRDGRLLFSRGDYISDVVMISNLR